MEITQRRVLRYHWVLLIFCLLDLFDLLNFSRLTPYNIVGPQLLENPDFSQDLQGWTLEGDVQALQTEGGVLSINHPFASDRTILSQCYPAREMPDHLFLSAQGMSRGVVPGEKPWHEAHIDLVGYDSQGQGDYLVKTRLISMQGDQAWFEGAQAFRNKSTYQQICVRISLFQATGLFQVRGLSLHQAMPNPNYRTSSLLLFGGWLVLGVWLANALFEYYRRRPQGRYLLIVFALLFIGILMPQAMRASLEEHILSFFSFLGILLAPPDMTPPMNGLDLWPQYWDLSKVSHLLGFTLLSGLLFTERNVSPVGRLFGLLLLAISTELLQLYVPERTPRLSDVMVDALGILLGWGVGRLILHFRHPSFR